jgi:acyl-CoA hydrolase
MERTQKKRVSESITESSKIILSKEINGQHRLFGGRLMEWIDEVGALTAMRHCGGLVTTCAVDHLVFRHGAKLNDVVVLKGMVTYVGNTSMEVRVDTFVEEIATGARFLINHAYLIFVHVDENGKPIPIRYGLDIQSHREQAEWDGAVRRAEIRKERYATAQ